MNSIPTGVLPGFLELLPNEQREFDRLKAIIHNAYEDFGFATIETPVIERADVLLAKVGGETGKQVYRFSRGDTDMGLRFDLTVPLARYVANHVNELSFPFKRCQIGKVYRGEKPQRGRFREFYQCDVDVIGKDSLELFYEAEMVAVIYEVFRRCKIEL